MLIIPASLDVLNLEHRPVRELRLLLILASSPGEWTQAGLAARLQTTVQNVMQPLRVLQRDGLLTTRRQREPHSKKPVTLYKAAV